MFWVQVLTQECTVPKPSNKECYVVIATIYFLKEIIFDIFTPKHINSKIKNLNF